MKQMKKILILVLLITLFGCQQEPEYNELGQEIITDQKTIDENIVTLINQCITAYNDNKIEEIQGQLNTFINPKPILVEEIKPVETLNQLTKETDLTSNADYIYRYKLDDNYSIVFRLFEPLSDFWLDATATFEVDTIKVIKDNPEYNSTKETLDTLLPKNKKTFDLLYGIGVEKGDPHPEKEGYFEALSFEGKKLKNIEQIKEYASKIFTTNFCEGVYVVSFNSEQPIYIEDNNKLYVQDTQATTPDSLPYDTSLILATEESDSMIKVDILAGYGESIIPQVFRINLIKENGQLLLDNPY